MHPFQYTEGTAAYFHRRNLARDRESHDMPIDTYHFRRVQNDPAIRVINVSPYFVKVVGRAEE
jgi:hypothetical protein